MRKMFFFLFLLCVQEVRAQEPVNLQVVDQIRQEGLKRSKVMDMAFYLTDVNGPRLAGSQGYLKAANWAKNQLTEFGLKNATLEAWGDFGRGWELERSYVAMKQPYYKPMIAFPKTWTSGTNGLQVADLLLIEGSDTLALAKYRGNLKGKIILLYRDDTLKHSFQADAYRYTEEDLQKMEAAKAPAPRGPADTSRPRPRRDMGPIQMMNKLKKMAQDEGAIAMLSMSPRGHDGTLFVQGGGSYGTGSPENFLDIMITAEDYLSFCRLLKKGMPVTLELDIKTKFNDLDTKGYNVIAEIPGSDPTLKDEIVMLGGHLDSWQGATGATDNASGCAVMIEAVRIIKSLNLKPKRTIRIALWGGEEQGLHGSRNYVKNHFADPATMVLKPEHEKFSSYFNIDNGTGRIRGIYLQGNEKLREIFKAWFKPFNDLGATTVTISNTGGTDHQAFDAVGLPGFQFIQDPIEYNTRTHHTNMDSYDHLIAEDLKQMATIVASFVYHAAMRDEKLPRKELPLPRSR